MLNGVDEQIWDARLDPYLPASFKPGQMQGKALCKRYLQQGLGMDVNPDKPLVVCVSRLVPQKGVDLIKHAIAHTKDQGGQFVLLGSGHSDPPFSQLASSVYKRDEDVKLLIFYSDQLSHLLYAAADFVLVRIARFPNPASLFAHTRTRRDVLPLLGRLTSALTVCAYIAIYKTDTFFYSS